MDNIEIFKWISGQTDRVWFLAALGVLVWTFLKQQKRNEAQLDKMRQDELEVRRERQEQVAAMQEELLKNCGEVTKVCTAAADAIHRNSTVLEQVSRKL